jgi:hypothetical protein
MMVSTNEVGGTVEGTVTPWRSAVRAILYLAVEWARQSLVYARR